MKIWLAPMEGLMDYFLREVVTSIKGFDLSVSEFIRVVDRPLPARVYLDQVPELLNKGFTKSGTPVRVQLLGSDPYALAENARVALELGSHGIDFNFGCPSNTVNRRSGGAALLQFPDQIYKILAHARKSLPPSTSISAKMRLGFEDNSKFMEIAHAIEDAGADEVVIHGRTKSDGYRPPADWESIGKIRESLRINVIANGDIFSSENLARCLNITGCKDVMIGRGAVYQPDLAAILKLGQSPLQWNAITILLVNYVELMKQGGVKERHIAGRIKQWVKLLGVKHDEAKEIFSRIKSSKCLNSISEALL